MCFVYFVVLGILSGEDLGDTGGLDGVAVFVLPSPCVSGNERIESARLRYQGRVACPSHRQLTPV